MTKTAQKILKEVTIVQIDKTRMVKAVRELESLGLVIVQEEVNDYGYKWLRIKNIEQK